MFVLLTVTFVILFASNCVVSIFGLCIICITLLMHYTDKAVLIYLTAREVRTSTLVGHVHAEAA